MRSGRAEEDEASGVHLIGGEGSQNARVCAREVGYLLRSL